MADKPQLTNIHVDIEHIETPEPIKIQIVDLDTREEPLSDSDMGISDNEVVMTMTDNDELLFYTNDLVSKSEKVEANLREEAPNGYGYRIEGEKAVFTYDENDSIMQADWFLIGNYRHNEDGIDFTWAWAFEPQEDELSAQLSLTESMRSVFAEDEILHYLANPRIMSEDAMLLHIIKAYCSHHLKLDYIADFTNTSENYVSIFGFRNIEWLDQTNLEVVEIDTSDAEQCSGSASETE